MSVFVVNGEVFVDVDLPQKDPISEKVKFFQGMIDSKQPKGSPRSPTTPSSPMPPASPGATKEANAEFKEIIQTPTPTPPSTPKKPSRKVSTKPEKEVNEPNLYFIKILLSLHRKC